MGYYRAGFDVTGVDNRLQKNYPFAFHLADALEFVAEHGHEYDAISASPPCQGYSRMRHLPWLKGREYPMLIDATRELLEASSRVWVIENVEDAPLRSGITLCGASLGLKIYRHRKFESSVLLLAPAHRKHLVTIGSGRMLNDRAQPNADGWVSLPSKAFKEVSRNSVAGHFAGMAAAKEIMGIDWMTRDELAQAIPPAYTEYIGRQLIQFLGQEAVA